MSFGVGSVVSIDEKGEPYEAECEFRCTHRVTPVTRRAVTIVEVKKVRDLFTEGWSGRGRGPANLDAYRAVDADGTEWTRDWQGWVNEVPGFWKTEDGRRANRSSALHGVCENGYTLTDLTLVARRATWSPRWPPRSSPRRPHRGLTQQARAVSTCVRLASLRRWGTVERKPRRAPLYANRGTERWRYGCKSSPDAADGSVGRKTMATDVTENTTLRLKAVLEVLAEALWTDEKRNAGEVLAEALQRVPPNEKERELLSGGIPRGHKNLTSATAKLVKAGWLSKGKAGWAITDDGLRAIVTFREPGVFGSALVEGKQAPEDVPVPTKAPKGFLPKKAPAKRRARVVKEAVPAADVATPEAPASSPITIEAASPATAEKPAEKPARRRSRKATAATGAPAQAAVQTEMVSAEESVAERTTEAPAQAMAPAGETFPQPDAVAVAGDFGKILGADEDWAPQYDEVQMKFDPADQLWKLTADLPAGFYQYKVALNCSWDENYGAFGIRDGANHELHHGGGQIRLSYDHRTKDVVAA